MLQLLFDLFLNFVSSFKLLRVKKDVDLQFAHHFQDFVLPSQGDPKA